MKWLLLILVLVYATAVALTAHAARPTSVAFMGKASLDKWECCQLVAVNQATTAIVVLDVGDGAVHFQLTRLGSDNDTFDVLDGTVSGHNGYVVRLQPAIYRASVTPASGAPEYLLLVDLNGE